MSLGMRNWLYFSGCSLLFTLLYVWMVRSFFPNEFALNETRVLLYAFLVSLLTVHFMTEMLAGGNPAAMSGLGAAVATTALVLPLGLVSPEEIVWERLRWFIAIVVGLLAAALYFTHWRRIPDGELGIRDLPQSYEHGVHRPGERLFSAWFLPSQRIEFIPATLDVTVRGLELGTSDISAYADFAIRVDGYAERTFWPPELTLATLEEGVVAHATRVLINESRGRSLPNFIAIMTKKPYVILHDDSGVTMNATVSLKRVFFERRF